MSDPCGRPRECPKVLIRKYPDLVHYPWGHYLDNPGKDLLHEKISPSEALGSRGSESKKNGQIIGTAKIDSDVTSPSKILDRDARHSPLQEVDGRFVQSGTRSHDYEGLMDVAISGLIHGGAKQESLDESFSKALSNVYRSPSTPERFPQSLQIESSISSSINPADGMGPVSVEMRLGDGTRKIQDAILDDLANDGDNLNLPFASSGGKRTCSLAEGPPAQEYSIRSKQVGANEVNKGSPCQDGTSQSSDEASPPAKRKRSREDSNNSDDHNNGKGGGGNERLTPEDVSEDRKRLFACPFYQRNPEKHGGSRACAWPGFKSISRLK